MPTDPLPHPSASLHHPVSHGNVSLINRANNNASPTSMAHGSSPMAPTSPTSANSPHHPSNLHGPNATPPKAGPINKLRGVGGVPAGQGTPKDTIPIAKTPRKQRSSRFHVVEKVEIKPLPLLLEVPPHERHDLFIQKLRQASVVFDFNDVSTDLQGKNIKADALTEMLDFISTQRGVITEDIYPEVVKMVSRLGHRSRAAVPCRLPTVCAVLPTDLDIGMSPPTLVTHSLLQICSAPSPRLSTRAAMPTTPKRTSRFSSSLGRTSRSFTSSF